MKLAPTSPWFQQIKADLPGWPEEVIRLWIDPIANSYGWPPPMPDLGAWRYALGVKGLDFWNAVRWERVDRPLTFEDFCAGSRGSIHGLLNTYVLKVKNEYSNLENGQVRFDSAFAACVQLGKFPYPVILLQSTDGLELIDGNHRVAALVYYQKLRKSPVHSKMFNEKAAEISLEQPVWIGVPPEPGTYQDFSFSAMKIPR